MLPPICEAGVNTSAGSLENANRKSTRKQGAGGYRAVLQTGCQSQQARTQRDGKRASPSFRPALALLKAREGCKMA